MSDDEREALRIAELDARQAAYRKEREDWFVDHEAEPEIATNAFFRGWDAAVDGGFRRSEVPEPSAEQWCGGIHICSNAEHDHQEPQPEPSDAQLIEARADFRNDPDSDGLTLGEAFNTGWSAALRAANEVR